MDLRTTLVFSVLTLAASVSVGCIGNFKSSTSCVRQCTGLECGSDGCGGICGTCGPNLSCVEGQCELTNCGNGRVDVSEECDPAIAAGAPGSCPTVCENDDNACTSSELFGNAASCDAQCKTFEIKACDQADGCCPADCPAGVDPDCSTTCGNDEVDDLETCDGDCPTEADCMDMDGNACTAPVLTGSAANCNAQCAEVDITECITGDGCCPAGCTIADDDDCNAMCGDNVVTGGVEECDSAIAAGMPGACPMDVATDCPDTDPDPDDACDVAEIIGMASDCSATCNLRVIDAPADGDGCCPAGATSDTDDDCVDLCGNNVLDQGENCDPMIAAGTAGYCPLDPVADCDDMDACTTDAISGMAADCTAECTNTEIMQCTNDDGCCYFACTLDADNDCLPLCDDYCTKAITNCTAGNAIYTDDDMSGDAMGECMTACNAFMFIAGTDQDMMEDSLWCRINHLELAAGDPVTHCPHGLEMSAVCNM